MLRLTRATARASAAAALSVYVVLSVFSGIASAGSTAGLRVNCQEDEPGCSLVVHEGADAQ